ncbi:TetR/AcrR family transcriptional regulator [Nesterenkonia pannonica]|uniref:TetR/AcrR family transcriptional regulator n=1 Tax=Nesterenkonia pannonica TaxID=1548602 RepID=UPI002164A605|nr:TetR/AcrR family transcriptional regulator [Nesterenkonia pannonica]
MPRKPYTKGRAAQERILDTALKTISTQGYGSTSLADIAREADMTPAGLLHHFGSKENLLVEILRRRDFVDTQRLAPLGTGPVPSSLQVAHHNVRVPGLIHLFVNVEADASDPNHPGHEYFRSRYETVSNRVATDISIRQNDGRFDPSVDAHQVATMIIALLDGLQSRWAVDPSSVNILETIMTFWNNFVEEKLTVESINAYMA